MDKTNILQFIQHYVQAFQSPRCNPYDFDNYQNGFKELGFYPNTTQFSKNHPEILNEDGDINADSEQTKAAFAKETDIQTLGDFIFAYARYQAKSAWSAADVDFKWHIVPLQRLAELCK